MKLKLGNKAFGEVDDVKVKTYKPVKHPTQVDGLVESIKNLRLHHDDVIRVINALFYRRHVSQCYTCGAAKDKRGGKLVFICKECKGESQLDTERDAHRGQSGAGRSNRREVKAARPEGKNPRGHGR